MATLGLVVSRDGQPKRLMLHAPDAADRRLALGIFGATQSVREPSQITYPLEPLVVDDLRTLLGNRLSVQEMAQGWRESYQQQAKIRVKLSGQVDSLLPEISWVSRMYPYQRVGARWLEYTQRGILGDDPGLGKTLQALTAAAGQKRVLIITLNGVKQHWARHAREWLGREVAVCEGSRDQRQAVLNKRPDWVIVNHEMLRASAGRAYRGILEREWDTVIVDEAHKFQGRKSAQSRGASKLQSKRLYLLTGTPIWNHPDSLWQVLNLLEPLRFTSYWRFVDEYCDVDQTNWGIEILGFKPATLERLRSVVAPYLLRRRKEDVLKDLPAKRRQVIEYDLSDNQKRAYREIRKKLRLTTEQGDVLKVYDSAISALSQLRLLCDAPGLVGLPDKTSPKDEALDELLQTLMDGERKVILFTWHKTYANYLATQYRGFGTEVVTGDTRNREEILQTFRTDPATHILVATIGAAGTGIDLIEATAAIFAEGSHVPTLNAQAEDRLHRIGQKTDVMIYRMAARGTVEEAIWQVSDDRQAQNDDLLSMRAVIQRVLTAQGEENGNGNASV